MKFALMDGGVLVRVQKLDRVFDRNDVVVMRFVDKVDDRRESRALAAAGWASDENDAILDVRNLLQLLGKIEIAELRRTHRNHAHDDRVRAALFEDIDAETRLAGRAERQISRTSLFQTIESRLLVADDQFGHACGMGRS